ncbi:pimeloyl-ACP methyl ester carboxylesterase [Chitinophaga sp. W3I9]|uniref:SMI1/KNR4 family protein n=1 Tax=Chitinophaga sp. W3I9 TaxID=3373924 RepID=UPI003D19A620
MHQFKEQIERISTKLKAAKQKDKQLKVFGASYHKYTIHPPLEEAQLSGFEKEHNISLPGSFRAFLLYVGHGGISQAGSAAGPYYGIYPLRKGANDLTSNPEKYLSEPVKIYPGISDDEWNNLIKETEREDLSDEAYDAAIQNIYTGILPIGSQGCAFIHGLVLNGEHAGKVVNIDIDRQKPRFTFESNFLDWYERWLDEIISEDLLADGVSWFGYAMGGSVTSLLEKYHAASDKTTRLNCITGIVCKRSIEPAVAAILEKEYRRAEEEYKRGWLQALTKFSYPLAKPLLVAYSDIDLLSVAKFIWWYAKDKSREWQEVIEKNILNIHDEEIFRFCTYLLEEMKVDYAHLIVPMTTHSNEDIRKTAFYTLGKVKKKAAYLDVFINGLNDPSNDVVHAALQALSGVKDNRLLPEYKKIAERFPTEQDHILSNLGHRLAEMGLTIEKLKK